MTAVHGASRSFNNQRIELMWRDVFSSCLLTYYSLFNHMEDCGILNVHLWLTGTHPAGADEEVTIM